VRIEIHKQYPDKGVVEGTDDDLFVGGFDPDSDGTKEDPGRREAAIESLKSIVGGSDSNTSSSGLKRNATLHVVPTLKFRRVAPVVISAKKPNWVTVSDVNINWVLDLAKLKSTDGGKTSKLPKVFCRWEVWGISKEDKGNTKRRIYDTFDEIVSDVKEKGLKVSDRGEEGVITGLENDNRQGTIYESEDLELLSSMDGGTTKIF
jgi:hypothetical protein